MNYLQNVASIFLMFLKNINVFNGLFFIVDNFQKANIHIDALFKINCYSQSSFNLVPALMQPIGISS